MTNTRGGMNMNCGIHDAASIARARALGTGDPARIAAASDERHRVATEMLIPRTDRTVTGGGAFTDTIRAIANDPAAARDYLRTSAMLDMLSPEDRHG